MYNIFKNTAWLYDIDDRDNLRDDIPFYIEYAKKTGGKVLELGCGTGRVSIALAREGIKVTGIDLSEQMLEIFNKKISMEPELKAKINLVHGNMANFNLNDKFSLIIAPFRAFQALTDDTDIINSLNCIYEHLDINGIFIINVFKPYKNLDESWCYAEKIQWERFDEKTGNYVVKKHWGDKIDVKNQIIYPHLAYEVTDPSGKKSLYIEDLRLKYYYEYQLEDILVKSGFNIIERFGWYDKKSIEEANREIIFVCNKNS